VVIDEERDDLEWKFKTLRELTGDAIREHKRTEATLIEAVADAAVDVYLYDLHIAGIVQLCLTGK